MTRGHAAVGFSTVVLVAITTLMACTSVSTGVGRSARAEPVDLPKGLVFPDGQAIAYRATGKTGTVIRDAEMSTRPLLARGVKAPAGFQVYEQFGSNYRAIAHRERGDRLIADIVAGKTYIVAPALTGRLRESLAALCRFTIEQPHRPPADIPRICTQILCQAQRFSAGSLAKTFGPLPDGMRPSLELGGWNPIPRDLCATCTRPRGEPADEPTFRVVCPAAPTPACDAGQVLFNDDFEADTVGNAPAPSPAGPPSGDAVSVSGDVTVVNAGSKAARLKRGNLPAIFAGILDTGATAAGSYCVKFTGRAGDNMHVPVVMTFNATNGARAWQLEIDNAGAALTSGGGRVVFLRDFSVPHSFRFDVNLSVRRFDMFVDGNQIVSGVPFLDTTFDVPSSLRFEVLQCILECFPAEYTVDGVRVTKTD